MPAELLPTLFVSLFVFGYTPGPANIYAMSTSIIYGRRASLKAWAGLLSGFYLAALAMAVAAHFAGMVMKDYVVYIKYIGAVYMMFLAWRTLCQGDIKSGECSPCSFLAGFLVQLTNAKMLLFDLTIYSTFVLPYSGQFIDLLAVSFLLLLSGRAANLLWMMAGSLITPYYTRHRKLFNTVMALLLLGCCVMIILL